MSEESKKVLRLHVSSGLGDHLLDVVGLSVLCASTDCVMDAVWEPDHRWGEYSIDLFDFPEGISSVSRFPADAAVHDLRVNTGLDLSPARMVADGRLPSDVDVAEASARFVAAAGRTIRPGAGLVACIPPGLDRCVGVHLRCSDKIRPRGQGCYPWETSVEEHERILGRLLTWINGAASASPAPLSFFVCSEDDAFRARFEGLVSASAPGARFVRAETSEPLRATPGAQAALDLFCLSRCRCVLQGIKHSTFSLVASVVGRTPLVNVADADPRSHVHLFAGCLPPGSQIESRVVYT